MNAVIYSEAVVAMKDINTISIVDDDEGARSAITSLLHEYGYLVKVYESGQDFLASYQNQPGCIILDIQMPGLSGLELQEKLINQNIFTPIIFVTGHATIEWSVQAMKRGAVNFLEKPYEEKVLIQSIEYAFEQDEINRMMNINCMDVEKKFETLTNREKEVVEYLVFGKNESTNKLIAKKMNISHRTVEEYRAEAMRKMDANSLKELLTMLIVCKISAKQRI